MSDPGWKRNGRNGPFDWWLSCKDHSYAYAKGCMSCSVAEDHNIDFQQKLDRERNAGVQAATAAITAEEKRAIVRRALPAPADEISMLTGLRIVDETLRTLGVKGGAE